MYSSSISSIKTLSPSFYSYAAHSSVSSFNMKSPSSISLTALQSAKAQYAEICLFIFKGNSLLPNACLPFSQEARSLQLHNCLEHSMQLAGTHNDSSLLRLHSASRNRPQHIDFSNTQQPSSLRQKQFSPLPSKSVHSASTTNHSPRKLFPN